MKDKGLSRRRADSKGIARVEFSTTLPRILSIRRASMASQAAPAQPLMVLTTTILPLEEAEIRTSFRRFVNFSEVGSWEGVLSAYLYFPSGPRILTSLSSLMSLDTVA